MIFKHGLNDLYSFVGRIAVDGSDYEGRSNVLLTFNADTTSIVVPVNITDDSVYEGEEDFSGTLTLVSDSPRVTIDPSNAVATILDNEGKRTTFIQISLFVKELVVSYCIYILCVIAEVTIGFIGAPYQAMENMGPMLFTVGVIGDTELSTDVVASFSTVDGSTSGIGDK